MTDSRGAGLREVTSLGTSGGPAPGSPKTASWRGARTRARGSGRKTQWAGLLFATPAIVMVAVFVLYPIVSTLLTSLYEWDGYSPERTFVGAENFVRMIGDSGFWQALQRNVLWIATMFLAVLLGLTLALILWVKPRGWSLLRTVYLIPEMMGPALVGILWLRLWQPVVGGMAGLGEALGIGWLATSPLGSSGSAIWVLLFTQVWLSTGFFIIVSLSGLQSIDANIIDAAAVDGASALQRVRYVVIPELRSHLSLMALLATIAGLKAFDIVWVMTQGGPGNATQLIGTYAYTQAFVRQDYGYAMALSCVTVVIALTFAALIGKGQADD